MRIRSIKPEFWRSSDISSLNIEDRLLFIGLWSYVDDNGVGVDKLSAITADLFADDLERDPSETFARVSRGLQNLAEQGRIIRYTVEDRDYLEVTNWTKHQRIDKPNKPKLPHYDAEVATIREGVASVSRESSDISTPGTGEQGNRGTGEQRLPETSDEAPGEVEPREDVDAILDALDEHCDRHGFKRPGRTKGNHNAARLLLDRDENPLDHVLWIIGWVTDHDFWPDKVMSATKLRTQFDKLKWQAKQQHQQHQQPQTKFMSAAERRLQEGYERDEQIRNGDFQFTTFGTPPDQMPALDQTGHWPHEIEG